jgi:phage tail-like protein
MSKEDYESKYLQYLPSIYQMVNENGSPAFLGRFLKAFEKILSGIDDEVEVKGEYLFRWDEIPGNDNEKLIEFLTQKFEIDWVKTAIIEKIDNDNTIKVSTEKNYLSLKINGEKTIVTLAIEDGGTDEFIANMENGKLNIYDSEPVKGIEEILDEIHDYFDPFKVPPDFLPWLAGWVALTLKVGGDWDETKKRELISQIVPLYKKRGTREGLEEYLKIYIGGEVRVLEELGPFQVGFHSTIGVDSVIGGLEPYFFIVDLTLPAPDPRAMTEKIVAIDDIINIEKPAHTHYKIITTVPTMRIGYFSTIGVNTLLWEIS